MCGIAAIVSPDRPIPPASLDSAIRALGHRGPDGHGRWMAPDGTAALGHTRLSIIDVFTGVQPIASEDGRYQIVVNGEFYGFEKIRSQLESRGHRFRTGSDSEIALHLYEEKGPACLEDLRGEFAFILWDDRDRELFAARDRFGIKPLFYAEAASSLYMASEAKALFAAGVPAAWDHTAAFQNLFLCLDQGGSLFQHIRQVPPGHYLHAKGHAVRLHRYWSVDYPRSPSGGSPQEPAAMDRGTAACAGRSSLAPAQGRRAGGLLSKRGRRLFLGPRNRQCPRHGADDGFYGRL